VLVKGGTFTMGDSNAEQEQSKPSHQVTVKSFYLDQNEVTNEQYQRFVKDQGYTPPSGWNGTDFPPGEGKFPVGNVSWFDAKAYAEWAGKRLPTEAEWEYAARGTDGRSYPWGADWSPQLSNSKEDGRNGPMAVGSYPRGVSPFQIFDMAGNVAEWVEDDYKPYEGSKAKEELGFKVYRGGAYAATKDRLKVTYRWYDIPTYKEPYIGFRCAADAPNQ
jgi:formylglycine-generating enzyme required for sulfatase activity